MSKVNEDTIHIIMDNLAEVINSKEIIEKGDNYYSKILHVVESFSEFLGHLDSDLNLMDMFIKFRKLYIEFELLMEYQIEINRLINKKALEMNQVPK